MPPVSNEPYTSSPPIYDVTSYPARISEWKSCKAGGIAMELWRKRVVQTRPQYGHVTVRRLLGLIAEHIPTTQTKFVEVSVEYCSTSAYTSHYLSMSIETHEHEYPNGSWQMLLVYEKTPVQISQNVAVDAVTFGAQRCSLSNVSVTMNPSQKRSYVWFDFVAGQELIVCQIRTWCMRSAEIRYRHVTQLLGFGNTVSTFSIILYDFETSVAQAESAVVWAAYIRMSACLHHPTGVLCPDLQLRELEDSPLSNPVGSCKWYGFLISITNGMWSQE
ncbi:hypothetical protein F5J12DRAFT_781914 [Pisolithus orientalis]|uniref:uncharacterized protein n=1 Tax=Pisolithus orientalis TaxID=936130 RepID=UPI0022258E3E|nr:uncharacterized protein F5J12DRAFT_781914 [Pisolithus orientalis]KAI6010954.1 hypothetical protein F5J12DRAFT_781914 [Pisolithus orientalis]